MILVVVGTLLDWWPSEFRTWGASLWLVGMSQPSACIHGKTETAKDAVPANLTR